MLYLIATPIGNLGDITYRAVQTLEACDEVWCEDTRQTAKLLNHLNIKKPLVSCHEYTQKEKAPQLLKKLRAGLDVAYVSDAGLPGISDPGAVLIQACIEAKLPYTVLPGPSAVLTAAVLSGLPLDRFTFFGFLPREGAERKQALVDIAACGCTAILYESPHRVKETLSDVLAAAGDCPCALVRELTKVYESCQRGPISEVLAALPQEVKGECVLLFSVPPKMEEAPTAEDLDALLLRLMEYMTLKDAAREASETLKLPKKQVYARALELRENES